MLTRSELRKLESEVENLKGLRDAQLAAGNNDKAANLNEMYTRKSRLLELELEQRKPDPNFKGKAF